MSKWDEIVKRDSLQVFPCPDGQDMRLVQCIAAGCPYEPPDGCALRPIYEEYLAMRAVVEAVIGPHPNGLDMQIEHYRELAEMALDAGSSGASASHGYTRLADALAELT